MKLPQLDSVHLSMRSSVVPHRRLSEDDVVRVTSLNGHAPVHAIAFSHTNGVSFSDSQTSRQNCAPEDGVRSKTKLWRRLLRKCGRLPSQSTSGISRTRDVATVEAPNPQCEPARADRTKQVRGSGVEGVRRALTSVVFSKYVCGSCFWCWLRRSDDDSRPLGCVLLSVSHSCRFLCDSLR